MSVHKSSLGLKRRFTQGEVDPYDMVEWSKRDARIKHEDGSDAFYQPDVEFPNSWSDTAVNIVAQKYFRGTMDTPQREVSLKQVINRVVDTITAWGDQDDYFEDVEEREAFRAELKYILMTQRAAFNSPVWFNIGVDGVPQQASACFILSVEDNMESIKEWWAQEADIFRGGSGAGTNLSNLRGSMELIGGSPNTSSGPLSFELAADSQAGAIKSGGKTRRAAKMVILDADHPDIEEFIGCKVEAEEIARVLEATGRFNLDIDGKHSGWIPYQNANNSVRVSDEFMRAVEDDLAWNLLARVDGAIVKTLQARNLMRQIAQAAWDCADPGIQFDATINDWHTTPSAGRINASNPCSEYMHLDNSSCNLASLNLLKFAGSDGGFDIEAYTHTAKFIFVAQDILVGNADYPTAKIGQVSRDYRQLGIGYSNLGALLMSWGLPYDSDDARDVAASLTAILTGASYLASTKMADRLGSFAGFEKDRHAMLMVLNKHLGAAKELKERYSADQLELAVTAVDVWSSVCTQAELHGVRNAQASVLAPTGTISYMMDCDTTGIEPDLGLVKVKKLVGGGKINIVNQTVEAALSRLGYDETQSKAIQRYMLEEVPVGKDESGELVLSARGSVVGAPGMREEHLPVFATSVGGNAISWMGHIGMMAATQPFISGAISKTVNMSSAATVEEIEQLYLEAWKRGLKSVAIYRENSKVGQPLTAAGQKENGEAETSLLPKRREMPRRRVADAWTFSVGGTRGYVHVGLFEDGTPGEIFLKVTKQGSTMAGVMDALAISVSLGLQYGVPLSTYVKQYVGTKYEPHGWTDDTELRQTTSLLDYIFKRLALDYLTIEEREALGLGILSTQERTDYVNGPGDEVPAGEQDESDAELPLVVADPHAPLCSVCGGRMVRKGACYYCENDGQTSGCS